MKITILSISDSDKHFSSAIDEYNKRVWKSVSIVNLKPQKHGTQSQIIQKETDYIIEKLQSLTKPHTILLSKDGKSFNTEQFASTLQRFNASTFIIGWPYGLDEERLTPYISTKISFWSITLPHGLAKLTLLEQIYRAQCIHSGKKYHY